MAEKHLGARGGGAAKPVGPPGKAPGKPPGKAPGRLRGKPPAKSPGGGGNGPAKRTGPPKAGTAHGQGRRERPAADRPRDPAIPEGVTADQLDKGIGYELRTLPEGLAEIVAKHLVAADLALVDEDIPLARAHIAAAKRRAGRAAPVREAAGVAAYLAGDYAEAIAELRTVRRMTGSLEYVPMLADCERGMGRPQRALEMIKEIDLRRVEPETKVELLLVAAGARSDMGQLDAAIVLLQVPELRSLPPGGARARLQYAYAELLSRAGRLDEADAWMRRAADSDTEGVTDAAERVDELAGVVFTEHVGEAASD